MFAKVYEEKNLARLYFWHPEVVDKKWEIMMHIKGNEREKRRRLQFL